MAPETCKQVCCHSHHHTQSGLPPSLVQTTRSSSGRLGAPVSHAGACTACSSASSAARSSPSSAICPGTRWRERSHAAFTCAKGVALAGHGRDEAAADHAYAAAASHSLLLHGVATLTRPHVGQRFTAVKGRRQHLVLQALLVGLALIVGAHCGRAVALAPARAAPVSVPVQARY